MQATTTEVTRTDDCGSVTAAIVRGMAELSGQDPTDLDICLGEHVDADAVEALFGPSAGTATGELRISVEDYRVLVDSGGTVTVGKRRPAAEESAMEAGT